MTKTDTVILAGRGPSIRSFDWPAGCDVAVVSGAVFALQGADHWITLDDPLNFQQATTSLDQDAWPNSDTCSWWNALGSSMAKHIPQDIMFDAWRAEDARCDPWATYPNVTGYEYSHKAPPNFSGSGMIGLDGTRFNNSLLFSVQVVAHLGYRRVIFAGCDLNKLIGQMYIAAVLQQWWPLAKEAGIKWVCGSPGSQLAKFLPVEVPA